MLKTISMENVLSNDGEICVPQGTENVQIKCTQMKHYLMWDK